MNLSDLFNQSGTGGNSSKTTAVGGLGAAGTAAFLVAGPWGLGAIAALGVLSALGLSVKGKTQHLTYAQVLTPGLNWGWNVGALIRTNLSSSQYASLSSVIADNAAAWMQANDWITDNADYEIRGVKTQCQGNIDAVLQNFAFWVFINIPSDRPQEAAGHLQQGLGGFLYPYLQQVGAQNLIDAINQILSGSNTSGAAPAQTGTSSNWLSNLFGGGNSKSTAAVTASSANQASLGKYVVIAIVAVILLGLFTAKGKHVVQAVAG